jgi:hypothetical protein
VVIAWFRAWRIFACFSTSRSLRTFVSPVDIFQ